MERALPCVTGMMLGRFFGKQSLMHLAQSIHAVCVEQNLIDGIEGRIFEAHCLKNDLVVFVRLQTQKQRSVNPFGQGK